jgi:hypothetical protein
MKLSAEAAKRNLPFHMHMEEQPQEIKGCAIIYTNCIRINRLPRDFTSHSESNCFGTIETKSSIYGSTLHVH